MADTDDSIASSYNDESFEQEDSLASEGDQSAPGTEKASLSKSQTTAPAPNSNATATSVRADQSSTNTANLSAGADSKSIESVPSMSSTKPANVTPLDTQLAVAQAQQGQVSPSDKVSGKESFKSPSIRERRSNWSSPVNLTVTVGQGNPSERPSRQIDESVAEVVEEMRSKFSSMRSAFRAIDTDGSRSISLPEFKQGLQMMGVMPPDDTTVAKMFKIIDTDASGEISLRELQSFVVDEETKSFLDAIEGHSELFIKQVREKSADNKVRLNQIKKCRVLKGVSERFIFAVGDLLGGSQSADTELNVDDLETFIRTQHGHSQTAAVPPSTVKTIRSKRAPKGNAVSHTPAGPSSHNIQDDLLPVFEGIVPRAFTRLLVLNQIVQEGQFKLSEFKVFDQCSTIVKAVLGNQLIEQMKGALGEMPGALVSELHQSITIEVVHSMSNDANSSPMENLWSLLQEGDDMTLRKWNSEITALIAPKVRVCKRTVSDIAGKIPGGHDGSAMLKQDEIRKVFSFLGADWMKRLMFVLIGKETRSLADASESYRRSSLDRNGNFDASKLPPKRPRQILVANILDFLRTIERKSHESAGGAERAGVHRSVAGLLSNAASRLWRAEAKSVLDHGQLSSLGSLPAESVLDVIQGKIGVSFISPDELPALASALCASFPAGKGHVNVPGFRSALEAFTLDVRFWDEEEVLTWAQWAIPNCVDQIKGRQIDGKVLWDLSRDSMAESLQLSSVKAAQAFAAVADLKSLTSNIRTWSPWHVEMWVNKVPSLTHTDKSVVVSALRKHAVDGFVLCELTQRQISQDLEISALGTASRLFRAIQALKRDSTQHVGQAIARPRTAYSVVDKAERKLASTLRKHKTIMQKDHVQVEYAKRRLKELQERQKKHVQQHSVLSNQHNQVRMHSHAEEKEDARNNIKRTRLATDSEHHCTHQVILEPPMRGSDTALPRTKETKSHLKRAMHSHSTPRLAPNVSLESATSVEQVAKAFWRKFSPPQINKDIKIDSLRQEMENDPDVYDCISLHGWKCLMHHQIMNWIRNKLDGELESIKENAEVNRGRRNVQKALPKVQMKLLSWIKEVKSIPYYEPEGQAEDEDSDQQQVIAQKHLHQQRGWILGHCQCFYQDDPKHRHLFEKDSFVTDGVQYNDAEQNRLSRLRNQRESLAAGWFAHYLELLHETLVVMRLQAKEKLEAPKRKAKQEEEEKLRDERKKAKEEQEEKMRKKMGWADHGTSVFGGGPKAQGISSKKKKDEDSQDHDQQQNKAKKKPTQLKADNENEAMQRVHLPKRQLLQFYMEEFGWDIDPIRVVNNDVQDRDLERRVSDLVDNAVSFGLDLDAAELANIKKLGDKDRPKALRTALKLKSFMARQTKGH